MNNLAPAGKLEIENKIKSKRKKEERKLIPVQDLILINPKLKKSTFHSSAGFIIIGYHPKGSQPILLIVLELLSDNRCLLI